MYERHFGFTAKPFALTPDPAFLYLSREHAMAFTMLEYGLESSCGVFSADRRYRIGKTTWTPALLCNWAINLPSA